MKRRWNRLFKLAKNVDVLNPTNTVDTFNNRKFVSPTSFPYLPEINEIPVSRYFNSNRKDDIVFCGSFVAQKNPLLAIEGFYSFLKNDPGARQTEARLVMIGKGDLLDLVKERLGTINQEFGKDVIVFGHESDLIDILSNSKIFLSLQDYDNYPSQSVMEAMLFCNSVISINNGDTPKLVDPNKHNILLEEKDPNRLGEAIARLLPGWELNKENREHILARFSAKEFADYFFDLHAVISREGGKPERKQ
jgi:glycosyltransferase involved in cell wall biosynthesis